MYPILTPSTILRHTERYFHPQNGTIKQRHNHPRERKRAKEMLRGTWYLSFSAFPETSSAIWVPVGLGGTHARASGVANLVLAPTQTAEGGHLDRDLSVEAKMAGLTHVRMESGLRWDILVG